MSELLTSFNFACFFSLLYSTTNGTKFEEVAVFFGTILTLMLQYREFKRSTVTRLI